MVAAFVPAVPGCEVVRPWILNRACRAGDAGGPGVRQGHAPADAGRAVLLAQAHGPADDRQVLGSETPGLDQPGEEQVDYLGLGAGTTIAEHGRADEEVAQPPHAARK